MAKQKIKVDPITQAKQAVQMFENMLHALDFVEQHVKEMIKFNLAHAIKQRDALEAKEEKKLDEMETQQSKMLI